jgi:hypothetical protein
LTPARGAVARRALAALTLAALTLAALALAALALAALALAALALAALELGRGGSAGLVPARDPLARSVRTLTWRATRTCVTVSRRPAANPFR